jgi:hypothetical protein
VEVLLMPGPPPKKPSIRRRRNKASTRKVVEMPAPATSSPAAATAAHDAPQLPKRACGCAELAPKRRPKGCLCRGTGIRPWHPLTLSWWRDVWSSEFKDEYIRTDEHGLTRLAMAVDSFYWSGSIEDLREIRLQEARFGLDVISRRRLEWMVKRPPSAGERAPAEQRNPRPGAGGEDPRKVLTMSPRRPQ